MFMQISRKTVVWNDTFYGPELNRSEGNLVRVYTRGPYGLFLKGFSVIRNFHNLFKIVFDLKRHNVVYVDIYGKVETFFFVRDQIK